MLAKLQRRFDAIETRRLVLLEDLAALTPAQRAFRPMPTAWCLTDVAQHLALVDGRTTRALTERRVSGVTRRRAVDVVFWMRVLDLIWITNVRVKMPVKGVAPDPAVTLDDAAARWANSRAALRAYLETIDEAASRALVNKHPVGGYMDISETLRFLEKHHDHHLHQVARLKRSREFPTTDRAASGTA